MNKTFLLILLLVANTVFSQNISEKDLIGKWKVIEVSNKPASKAFDEIIKGFMASTIKFNDNYRLEWTSTEKDPPFSIFLNEIKDAEWVFNDKKHLISIGTIKNKYSFLQAVVARKGKNLIFSLRETELKLELERIPE